MQPTAQAVGGLAKKCQAPEGRKIRLRCTPARQGVEFSFLVISPQGSPRASSLCRVASKNSGDAPHDVETVLTCP
jgi:hypothetical protein